MDATVTAAAIGVGGSVIVALAAFWANVRNTNKTTALTHRALKLTEQGQVTDQYTKAVEQLGSDKARSGWAPCTHWSVLPRTTPSTARPPSTSSAPTCACRFPSADPLTGQDLNPAKTLETLTAVLKGQPWRIEATPGSKRSKCG